VSVSVDPRIGSELFGYRVEALLGRGGMSVVYRAHDLALDRKVALKLLAPELAEDERFRSRFLRESRVAASLDHPNVIPIYEAGESEGLLCIAMRYVEGTDLKRLLRAEGGLEPEQALDHCAQVAAALDTAHAHGLVHRDVKPSNVLISTGGHCYLADFGLTQDGADRSDLTLTGQVVGSVDYAAPEQIEGKPVDGRADVYSLGCLLYECLTGSVPFPKDSDLAVLWAHVNDPPPGLASYPTLEPVVKRALAKRPDDRHQTCSELVDAARDALPKAEPPPRRRRYRRIALVAAVLAAGLAAGLVLVLGGGSNAKTDLTVRANTLVRIDPRSNKITGVIGISGVPTLLVGPFDVAAAGKTVWIYNWADHTVRAIDAESNEPGRIVAVSGFPPSTGNSLAADKDGVWVLSSNGGAGILTRAKLGIVLTREYPLRYGPLAVAVGAGSVWVSGRSATGAVVLRIDPSTGEVLRTVKLPGAEIRSIAVGEGAVWTLQTGGIYRLDPGTAKVTGNATLPAYQVGQLAAGAGAVWATLQLPSGGTVLARVNPHTLQVRRIPLPKGQGSGTTTRVAVGRGSVWWEAPDAGVVYRVDPGSGRIVSAVHVTPPLRATADAEPVSVAAGADAVWVTVTFGFAP
jgi:serine/threonine protein kinase/streptogramin lyase